MTTVAVIPARYGSSRLPAKALARQTGKYLVQHVYERVALAQRVDRVIVATDDERIVRAVNSFGGEVRMTQASHPNGTSRVAELARSLSLERDDLVLNVQGDEPEIDPGVIDRLVQAMRDHSRQWPIGTAAAPFPADGPCEGPGSPADPGCVKVVCDAGGRALYFSRSLVPFPRSSAGRVDDPSRWLQHMGLYAFRAGVLIDLAALPQQDDCSLDVTESLEQLAWLWAGLAIGVVIVEEASRGIDTPEDYAAFVRRTQPQSLV